MAHSELTFANPVDLIYALNKLGSTIEDNRTLLEALITSTSSSLVIDDGEVLSNISGSSATAIGNTVTDLFDYTIGSSNAMVPVRIGGTWTGGLLTQPAAGLTIAAAAGAITFALADDLAAVEGLSTAGLATRTGTSTWTTRSVAGTASRIAVANGDGVAGNPTVDIDAAYVGQTSITTLGTIATGTWQATIVGLTYGGTGANLSATGGTNQFVAQASAGAAFTVLQPTYAHIGSGSTSATATGLTISGGTLTGDTTLPGSGQIDTTGYIQAVRGGSPIAVSAGTVGSFQASTAAGTEARLSIIGGNAGVSALWFGDTDSESVGQLSYSHSTNILTVVASGGIAITSGTLAGLTGLAIRDTSAAFDVTIAATSAPALSAGRTLTIDMSNVAHTLDLGATANTITFPNDASPQLAAFDVAQTWTATQTSMTLSGATLSGLTTLTDSGQITTGGELSLGGGSPTSRLHVLGTYTSANQNLTQVGGTHASSVTTTQRAVRMGVTFAPSGASLTTMMGIDSSPTINSTAFTIANYIGFHAALSLGASFSGTATVGANFYSVGPTVSAGNFGTFYGYFAAGHATSNGLSAGTATNIQLFGGTITSGAAGGTVNNRAGQFNVPSGGASSGTANNTGVFITGNGGTAAGGTVNNYAIYCDSTAPSYIEGGLNIGATTDPGDNNLIVVGTIRLGTFTVATLPAAGTAGRIAYVTDALAPAFLTAVVGGGAVVTPVFDDGANWVAM